MAKPNVALPGTRWAGGGISGIAILGIVAGVVLVVSGLRNAPVADVTRAMLRGQRPPSGPSMVPNSPIRGAGGGGGSATGAAVAEKAQSYIGVPYDWGGETPDGWDCSGFVTYVLHHDFGLELPSNYHTVTGQFLVWSGARTVPRAECQPGDLVVSAFHMGIATGRDTMVHAPGTGLKTQLGSIDSGVFLIRRPLAYGGSS